MAEEKTVIIPEGQSNGWNSGIPAVLALNGLGYNNYPPYAYGNGGLFGGSGSGFGAGILGGIVGGLIWNGIGGGNWNMNSWGNGGGAAASLGAQATAIGNTETILRAVDGTDSDVRLLATTLNSDINSVKENLCTLGTGLATLSGQLGLSREQIMNSILSGNAGLAQQLCSCCCEMKQLVTSQGYENQIRTIEQTNTLSGAIADLKTTVVDQFCALERRDMQNEINTKNEIITQLRNEADNARQSSQLMGYINSVVAPIAKDVDDIKCKLPSTVAVPYPQLSVINTTPNFGPNYGGWGGFGNGFGGFGGFGGNIVF